MQVPLSSPSSFFILFFPTTCLLSLLAQLETENGTQQIEEEERNGWWVGCSTNPRRPPADERPRIGRNHRIQRQARLGLLLSLPLISDRRRVGGARVVSIRMARSPPAPAIPVAMAEAS
jgi:hypothetical protein